MARVDVSVLGGGALDYAVLLALGYPKEGWSPVKFEGRLYLHKPGPSYAEGRWEPVAFWDSWKNTGPIIEREHINLVYTDGEWIGSLDDPMKDDWDWTCNRVGPTPLVAGLRCFVRSRLGDAVEIPEWAR